MIGSTYLPAEQDYKFDLHVAGDMEFKNWFYFVPETALPQTLQISLFKRNMVLGKEYPYMIHQKLHAMNIVTALVCNLFRQIVAYICTCLGSHYKN